MELNKIIHADCMDIMKDIPDNYFELCLTDPPYGCNVAYNSYEDSQENLVNLINKFEPEIKRISKFAMITPGNANIKHYKLFDYMFILYQPASMAIGHYGSTNWQPILIYGKEVLKKFSEKWTLLRNTEPAPKLNHPCPKPLQVWKKMLLRGSAMEGDKVFDPFSGSGTTAIACIDLNRNYLCIEKDNDYFDASLKRIAKENIKIKMDL